MTFYKRRTLVSVGCFAISGCFSPATAVPETGAATEADPATTAAAATIGEASASTSTSAGREDSADASTAGGPSTTSSVDEASTGEESVCGDGLVAGAEECEPGVPLQEGCSDLGFLGGDLRCGVECTFDTAECQTTSCGNGVVDDGEECDPAADQTSTCTERGFDDGPSDLPCDDSCRFDVAACLTFSCGNDVLEGEEECEPNLAHDRNCSAIPGGEFDSGTTTCNATNCRFSLANCGQCGNGQVDGDEECDEGDANSETSARCTPSCTVPECGDGVREGAEECDEGSRNGPQSLTCTPECTTPRCGDGFQLPTEACDDGNRTNGDGCDSNCIDEQCFQIRSTSNAPYSSCPSGTNTYCTNPSVTPSVQARLACEACEGVPCQAYTTAERGDCTSAGGDRFYTNTAADADPPNNGTGRRMYIFQEVTCNISCCPSIEQTLDFGAMYFDNLINPNSRFVFDAEI